MSSEKTVRLGDRTVTITGDDGDGFVADLPPEIREPALDCANVVLTDTSVVLDIGANLGLLTIGFADLVPGGRVVAIEPAPRTFQRLSENVAGAELKNVDLLNLALSDSAGTLEFFESDWFSAGSFVKERTLAAGIHTGAITVEARTVDELVDDLELRHVDFMKIDVEGHELKVLRGAKRTIAEMRPIAVIELNLFTTTSFGNVLPIDFVTEIRDIFPYVYDYRIGEGVFAISDDNAVYSRVQQQFLTGRPSDLICSFEPLTELAVARLVDLANAEALGGDLHGGGRDRVTERALQEAEGRFVAGQRELAVAHAAIADLRDREAALAASKAAAEAASEAALATAHTEIASLYGSTSWKATAPLRWLSGKLQRR